MKCSVIWRSLLLVSALLIGAMPASAQEKREHSVQVTGYAERVVSPDKFVLMITIAERDSRGKISVDEQYREVVAALKGVNIDPDERLRTADNSSQHHKKGEMLSTARYRLTLHNTKEMSRCWRTLKELSLSRVELESVDYTKRAELQRELRREAILDARQKAEELVSALGQELGPCISIYDRNTPEYGLNFENNISVHNKRYMAFDAEYADFAEEESGPLAEFRPLKATYEVTAAFAL